tara:strand:- start:357 stop:722 length:366 start_codon:yes stop_codon:yes gene_type:complete
MKHLLSILTLLGIVSLIFVSCSKSPEQYVENCADTKFIDTRESMVAKYERLSNETLGDLLIQVIKKDISFVKWKSLQKKLQKKDYSNPDSSSPYSDTYRIYFEKCSNQLRKNEVLFKAKWK